MKWSVFVRRLRAAWRALFPQDDPQLPTTKVEALLKIVGEFQGDREHYCIGLNSRDYRYLRNEILGSPRVSVSGKRDALASKIRLAMSKQARSCVFVDGIAVASRDGLIVQPHGEDGECLVACVEKIYADN